MQIRYLNRALQRFDSTQVIPTQFVLFTLSVIIGSAVLYRDFESTTATQAGKFIGGCALTFTGVYLITSGRTPLVEESELDEEEALSLLRDESLQERPQWGPDRDIPGRKPDRKPSDHEHRGRSTPRSLLDDDIDDEDDGSIRTPRIRSSLSPSSRLHSVSVNSLVSSHQEDHSPSSPSAPQSLTENPWLLSEERPRDNTTLDLARASHPELSPRTREGHPPAPSVLLRFPSAPGLAETPPRGDSGSAPTSPYPPTPAAGEPTREPIPRHTTAPHTPPSLSRNRHSISRRFAPKPLVAPLSSGLNAIVAESLRRRGSGELAIPFRRNSATLGRSSKGKRRIYTDELEGGGGDGPDDSAIAATPTPDGDDEEHDIIGSAAKRRRRQSTDHGNVAAASPSRRQSTMISNNPYTAEGDQEPSTTAHEGTGRDADHVRKHHRVRSLSDSWRDGIKWLSNIGEDERERKKRWKGDDDDPDPDPDADRQQSDQDDG